jgi:hypothetical protein
MPCRPAFRNGNSSVGRVTRDALLWAGRRGRGAQSATGFRSAGNTPEIMDANPGRIFCNHYGVRADVTAAAGNVSNGRFSSSGIVRPTSLRHPNAMNL